MSEFWRQYWRDHGTKILGLLTTGLAALYFVSDDILDVIRQEWRPYIKIGFALIGYFVLKRGQGNTERRGPPYDN